MNQVVGGLISANNTTNNNHTPPNPAAPHMAQRIARRNGPRFTTLREGLLLFLADRFDLVALAIG